MSQPRGKKKASPPPSAITPESPAPDSAQEANEEELLADAAETPAPVAETALDRILGFGTATASGVLIWH